MLGMHPPFFQGVLVPLNMTNPVRFMTNPCFNDSLDTTSIQNNIRTKCRDCEKGWNSWRTIAVIQQLPFGGRMQKTGVWLFLDVFKSLPLLHRYHLG